MNAHDNKIYDFVIMEEYLDVLYKVIKYKNMEWIIRKYLSSMTETILVGD